MSAEIAEDEQLLVPRLVMRIAELEHALHTPRLLDTPAPVTVPEGGSDRQGILRSVTALLKRAQEGLDSSLHAAGVSSLLVGGLNEEEQGWEQEELEVEVDTQEATSQALVITARKFRDLKSQKGKLEETVAELHIELAASKAALEQVGGWDSEAAVGRSSRICGGN
jgi:hypothetical protein